MRYPVQISKEGDGFMAVIPDLDGTFTNGDTMEETLANAKEAMDAYLKNLMLTQLELPHKPSKIRGDNVHYVPVNKQIEFVITLKRRRQELRLTQSDVANKLGITYQSYQKLEDITKSNPTLKTIMKLEHVMDFNFQLG